MRYGIHPHVDLDAVACLTAVDASEDEIVFVPSQDPVPEGTRALDHPAGEKGRLDPDGTRHAAVCSLPEARDWPADLLAEIDEADSTGRVLEPRYSLQDVVAGLRMEASDRGLRGEALDRAVYRSMRPVLRGLVLHGRARETARWVARNTRIEVLSMPGGPWDGRRCSACGGPAPKDPSEAHHCSWCGATQRAVRIALLPPGDTPPSVGIVLNEEHGVSGAIYQDGLSIGVTRYPGREQPDLRRLERHLPGWFIHTAGFLAAWGSRKAPPRTPPPAGTPQTQEELLALLRRVYGPREEEP